MNSVALVARGHYSMARSQDAMQRLFRIGRDLTGGLSPASFAGFSHAWPTNASPD